MTDTEKPSLLRRIRDYFLGHLYDLSYFIGRVVAQGFHDRMEEIAEEEHLSGDMICEDCELEIYTTPVKKEEKSN